MYFSSEYEKLLWIDKTRHLKDLLPSDESVAHRMSRTELQTSINVCEKFHRTNMGSFLMRSNKDAPLLFGDLHIILENLTGIDEAKNIFIIIEVDSYGHFFKKIRTRTVQQSQEPKWDDEFVIELEGSENVRILVYEDRPNEGTFLLQSALLKLERSWLNSSYNELGVLMTQMEVNFWVRFLAEDDTIRRVPTVSSNSLFKSSIGETSKREKRAVPFIISSLVQEVERRGITEVGIYRVNGSASEMARLRRGFESNPYQAEQVIKECDIHAVAGILKQYLRDLPECIFTFDAFNKLIEANRIMDEKRKSRTFLHIFCRIPQNPNQTCIMYILEHLVKVSHMEQQNKMSLHNLTTVFGPTMLHPGSKVDKEEAFVSGAGDVLGHSGILHYFLSKCAKGEEIQIR